MKKYRLKQWYPSLYDDWEVETVVEYDNGWIYYINKRGNKTAMEIDEWELSHKDFWELIEEKEPLFVTEEGVEVFDKNINFIVVDCDFEKFIVSYVELVKPLDTDKFIYFAHESNADEYIWRNKPLFSYEDIFSYLPTGSDIGVFEQLAKERIER